MKNPLTYCLIIIFLFWYYFDSIETMLYGSYPKIIIIETITPIDTLQKLELETIESRRNR